MTDQQQAMRTFLLQWREQFTGVGKSQYLLTVIDRLLEGNPTSLHAAVLDAQNKKEYYKAIAENALDLNYTYWRSCCGFIEMLHGIYERERGQEE